MEEVLASVQKLMKRFDVLKEDSDQLKKNDKWREDSQRSRADWGMMQALPVSE